METHKKMSKTVAKLLILLKNLDIIDKFGTRLAEKLCLDYNYVVKTLKRMEAMGYIRHNRLHTKTFYHLLPNAPIEEALTVLSEIALGHTEQMKFVETQGFTTKL